MFLRPDVSFAPLSVPEEGTVAVLATDGLALSDSAKRLDPRNVLSRAAAAAEFTGKSGKSLEVLAPEGSGLDRLVVLGVGKRDDVSEHSWLKLGGALSGFARKGATLVVVADIEGGLDAQAPAWLAAGLLLRAYGFTKYKTKKDDADAADAAAKPAARVVFLCADPDAAREAFVAAGAAVEGVYLARDLVNEPANKLGPEEFAARASELTELGVSVEVMDEDAMRGLGMGSLLSVSQGSGRPARLVVMEWKGGGEELPVAFVGKGVVFDTGGNSMKPASGMEDMKGDMGGAAAVVGVLHTLAKRKARANVVGIIGCVENMVDGNSQRPGDIVTSLSGQTIEVLNTDAEGRLVLADALWYCNDRFKPQLMVDLATLTGAIIVALGQSQAGLFSNDDALSERLTKAGLATDERLWRMPLGPDYDKLIDSKNADMKNIGGRYGGSSTAAQFLKRFVRDTPWAHLDIAGTAMAAPATDINTSWGSGFGVRLLDRFVRDNYEGATREG